MSVARTVHPDPLAATVEVAPVSAADAPQEGR
jgi:hypothetical protein